MKTICRSSSSTIITSLQQQTTLLYVSYLYMFVLHCKVFGDWVSLPGTVAISGDVYVRWDLSCMATWTLQLCLFLCTTYQN